MSAFARTPGCSAQVIPIALLADSPRAGACPLASYLNASLGCDAEQMLMCNSSCQQVAFTA